VPPTDDLDTISVPAASALARYPSLAGRTALVTGGASGIGETIVRALVRNGARVGVLDVNAVAGEALAHELGEQVLFARCDLTDIAELRVAVAAAEQRFGPVRVLVNNAANDQRHLIGEITPEAWDAAQAVNIRHHFFAVQAVLDGMRGAGGGAIVSLSSTAWMAGAPDLVPYTTAKAAVIGMTRSLGTSLGPSGIRVNAVAPGAVPTPRQLRLWYTEQTVARWIEHQAIPSAVREVDVANAVLFLCADDSRMITKQCLTVDGGSR